MRCKGRPKRRQKRKEKMKMPKRDDREYRAMPVFAAAGEGDEYIVEGYASTFEPYVLFEEDGIAYSERIEPTAFDEADMTDVIFQRDHSGTVMARTSNGTIELTVDEHGLHQRADLGKTESARQMYEEIKAGMYTQMSFAFTVAQDAYDRDTRTRIIQKIKKVYDVSAVSFPANPGTDIGIAARSFFDGEIEREKQEMLERERRIQRIRILAEIERN